MTEENLEIMPYMVGGLLYAPAINAEAVNKIICGRYKNLTSAAFCLEDTVLDNALKDAEYTLKLCLEKADNTRDLPLMFVRVRSPEHLEHIHSFLGKVSDVLTGYILPKFDLSNGWDYIRLIKSMNSNDRKIFAMPILESKAVADIDTRRDTLKNIKRLLDDYKNLILNVRVGGNDFCNLYGLRRSKKQTIYDIGAVRDIMADIINVFSAEYVVSAPVWEYFGDNLNHDWAHGLRRELEFDRINGFIGKTAVHPSQLELIRQSLMAEKSDYDDALDILNWSFQNSGVGKSKDGERMNEIKCHIRWARRTKILGDIYGVKE